MIVVVALSALAVVAMAEDEADETPTPTHIDQIVQTVDALWDEKVIFIIGIATFIGFIILFIGIPVIKIVNLCSKKGIIYNEALGLPKGSVRAIMAFFLIICIFIRN